MVYRLMKGAKISISTDKNVNNEFIPGYPVVKGHADEFLSA
jgi:hypothetical protein